MSDELEARREIVDWIRSLGDRITDLEEAIEDADYPAMRAKIGREGYMWTVRVTEKPGEAAHMYVRRDDTVIADRDVTDFATGCEMALRIVHETKSAESTKGEGDGTA